MVTFYLVNDTYTVQHLKGKLLPFILNVAFDFVQFLTKKATWLKIQNTFVPSPIKKRVSSGYMEEAVENRDHALSPFQQYLPGSTQRTLIHSQYWTCHVEKGSKVHKE